MASFLDLIDKLPNPTPKVVITALIVGLTGGFTADHFIMEQQISVKDERIKSKDDQIKDLQSQVDQLRVSLGIDPAKPGMFATLSNQDLRRAAENTAAAIMKLAAKFRTNTEQEILGTGQQGPGARWQQALGADKAGEDVLLEYKIKYYAKASLLYQEMKTRGVDVDESDESKYFGLMVSNPTNAIGLEKVAETLQRMAAALPDSQQSAPTK